MDGQTAMDIKKLKTQNIESEIQRMRKHIRPDYGVHLDTKLKAARGHRRKTLLDIDVRKAHSVRLLNQFKNRWGKLKFEDAHERLRFWTVLGSVCAVDENEILEHVQMLDNALRFALNAVAGVEVIGVFEIEFVSWELMESMKEQGNLSDDGARKLSVLRKMNAKPTPSLYDERKEQPSSSALVHFHGIIDFGMNADAKEKKLKSECKKYWSEAYQVEFDRLHKDKKLNASLQYLAEYLLKVKDNITRYKIGFGSNSYERLEAKMVKAGKKHLGSDYEGDEDSFSLSFDEIRVLDNALDRLMARTNSTHRNGYQFRFGQQVKWVK